MDWWKTQLLLDGPWPTSITSPNRNSALFKQLKAAMAMIKQTKGFYTKESSKFKHGGDLNFFCKLFEKHLQKHGLDSVAYWRCPTNQMNMMSLFTNYPKFLAEDIKKQNIVFGSLYDK